MTISATGTSLRLVSCITMLWTFCAQGATLGALKKRLRVLVVLGWHDVRTLVSVGRYAREAGWHLETRHFFDEAVPWGWRGDGMIVSSPTRRDVLDFIRRQAPRQPTVLIDRRNPGIRAPHVFEDNLAAGRMAAEHFLELGHKHFAWWNTCTGPVPRERLAGFQEALLKAGCNCEALEYRAGRRKNDWGRKRAWLMRRLRALPRPIALFALDDQLAGEAVEACLESKLRVPQDVAVAGVGNIGLICETSSVPITSVDNAPEEIALAGARLLTQLMEGGRVPSGPVVVPPRALVVRPSSDAVAVTHPTMLRAVKHVRDHLASPLDVQSLAAAAGVSHRTLHYLFQSELRCTPAAFMRRERMAQARRMLTSPKASLKEVISACGFGTARTMHRLFLQYEGCSPGKWKKDSRIKSPTPYCL